MCRIKLIDQPLLKEFALGVAQMILKEETVSSPETGLVTVRSCQDYLYEFSDEEVEVLMDTDIETGGFTDEEMALAKSLASSADKLRDAYEAAHADIFHRENTEKFLLLHGMITRCAVIYFCAYFHKELSEALVNDAWERLEGAA